MIDPSKRHLIPLRLIPVSSQAKQAGAELLAAARPWKSEDIRALRRADMADARKIRLPHASRFGGKLQDRMRGNDPRKAPISPFGKAE